MTPPQTAETVPQYRMKEATRRKADRIVRTTRRGVPVERFFTLTSLRPDDDLAAGFRVDGFRRDTGFAPGFRGFSIPEDRAGAIRNRLMTTRYLRGQTGNPV